MINQTKGENQNMELSKTQGLIAEVCESLKTMLIEKNKSYGNSSLEPIRIFAKASDEEQLNSRIDDKLSRIARGNEYDNEDTVSDLIGYLILKKVQKRMKEEKKGGVVGAIGETGPGWGIDGPATGQLPEGCHLCRIESCCPVCGGHIIGDGHTMTRHCENVDLPNDIEPDAPPVFCKRKKVYISGPMRGYRYYNFDAFMKAEEELRSEGYDVFNPAAEDLKRGIDPYTFPDDYDWDQDPAFLIGEDFRKFVMRDAEAIIMECTHILMLPFWEKSTGANAEYYLAKFVRLKFICA